MSAARKIRVAHVISRLNVGGPALQVPALCARLPVDRFESCLFIGNVSPGEAEMVSVLELEKVIPVRIPGLGRAIDARQDLRALARLVAEFRRFRPDVVHTHAAKAGALGRIAAKLCGVPAVVHTFHGHVFEGYFSRPISWGVLATERKLAWLANAIVTVSPRQRADITERFRVAPAHKTHVINCGFDFSRFDAIPALRGALRAELKIDASPIVSIVARLTPIKDHSLLFRALSQIGESGAHLCVVGGGEREAELRALAANLGLSSRTHFLGFRSDLERILADTDVVALTSLNEGTPFALIEALAAGCSVASVAVGGVADVLEDGKWGWLARARTPEAFADALRGALKAHRVRPSETIAAGQRYAREAYGIDRTVRDHASLYESLLSQSRREDGRPVSALSSNLAPASE